MTKSKALVILAAIGASTGAFAQFFDNFDSYSAGTQLHGVNGWKGWANSAAAGALVSNAQSFSAPNSVSVTSTTDLVHEFTGATSGQWVFSARVFVPVAFTGTAYTILMSNYNDAGTGLHWSAQVNYNGTTNMVSDDSVNGGTVTPQPLVRGQWALLNVAIDLTNNTRLVTYNGAQVSNGTWTDGTGGTLNVGAVDLFGNTGSEMFTDNVSLQPVPEPMSIAAVGIGCLVLLRRRRSVK
jgi:hypothetical protein